MGTEITGDVRQAPGAASGKWMTAAALIDLMNEHGVTEIPATIRMLTQEKVQDIRSKQDVNRQALWFANKEKGLIMNKTNLETLGAAFGWNAAAWKGKRVAMYTVDTQVGAGIRLRVL